MANVINATSTGNGGLITTGDDSGILNIQTNETTAVSVDASQNVDFTNVIDAPNTFGFKNKFINGDFRIDQRNAGALVTPTSGTTTLFMDMWRGYNSQGSKWTAQRVTTSPPAGFAYYANLISLSAYTLGSTDQFQFTTPIEGLNMIDLGWGTASAKTVTISFWVYSSLTGAFPVGLRNGGSPGYRSYITSFTVTSANTWQQVSITIPGDTAAGYYVTDNTMGLQLTFCLGAGSTFTTGTTNAWQSGNYLAPSSGVVNFVSNNAAVLNITGVQFEKGTQATSFDFRDYGREFIMCQRYYQRFSGNTNVNLTDGAINVMAFWTATDAYTGLLLPVNMRTAPTQSYSALSDFTLFAYGNTKTPTSIAFDGASTNRLELVISWSGGLTAGYSGWLRINNSAGWLAYSSEL